LKLLNNEGLFEYALKTLGGRAMSTGELREKLKRKAERVADVDGVIAKLKDYGYLNDKQYAELYASRRLENEGFGKARVLSDLRSKRVAPAVAERAVQQTFASTDEVELIKQFLARKYRRTPLAEVLAETKGLASAYRKLRGAGFTHGNSMKVLKEHGKDAESLDALDSQGE
jgi:regulatory protein